MERMIEAKYADSVKIKGFVGGTVWLKFYSRKHYYDKDSKRIRTGWAVLDANAAVTLANTLLEFAEKMV